MALEKDNKTPGPKDLEALYAKAKHEFSTDDLNAFFTEEQGIPLEKFIKDVEESFRAQEAGGGAP